MDIQDYIAGLPVAVDGPTGRLGNHAVVHAGIQDHEARLATVENSQTLLLDLDISEKGKALIAAKDSKAARDVINAASQTDLQELEERPAITLVQSHDEGSALPAGTVYALPAGSVPEPEPEPGTDQTLVSPIGRTTTLGSGRISDGLTTIVNPHGEKAGVVVTALATKASDGQRPQYSDAPTTVLMEPYWKGTLIGHIVATPNDSNLTIDFGDTGIQGIAASVFIEGITVDQLVLGTTSDREQHGVPTEILAPKIDGQALAFFFERTTAQENPADITFNSNWQPVEVGVGDGIVETVVIAVGGPSDAIATYPNPQALNGIGVQVGIRA